MNMPAVVVYPSMEKLWVMDRLTMLVDSILPRQMARSMLELCALQCRKRDYSQEILVISVWMDALLLKLTRLRSMLSSVPSALTCNIFPSVSPELCLGIALLQPVR